jgi:xylan 1,4-beta-xylosidase
MKDIRFSLDAEAPAIQVREEMEILYVLTGRVGVMLPGENFLLQPEDFIVFNAMEYHEIYKESGAHTLSLFLPVSILQRCNIFNVQCCSSHQSQNAEYMDMIRGKLAVIYKNYQRDSRYTFVMSQVYSLLSVLGEQFQETAENRTDGKALTQMRKILYYIHEHYTEGLTLEEVAKANYLSPAYVSRQFEKYLGLHFTEYLKRLRTGRAAIALCNSRQSITDIALSCGYSNPNTMILHFKDIYGQTPGEYRKTHAYEPEGDEQEKQKEASVYFVNLLKYAVREEMHEALQRERSAEIVVHGDVRRADEPLELKGKLGANLDYASYFVASDQEAFLRRDAKKLGMEHMACLGIFDEDMAIYHKAPTGEVWYNFKYLDLLFDVLTETGQTPWVELSRTPKEMIANPVELFNGAYVQLPDDIEGWEALVEATLLHFRERYGDAVETWRFSVLPSLYTVYGVFSMEAWLNYYLHTYRVIRRVLKRAVIAGGTFDAGLLQVTNADTLRRFLAFCRENACMPDEISLQTFSVDYSNLDLRIVESRIKSNRTENDVEPVPPSRREDELSYVLSYVKGVLRESHCGHLPISVLTWNSSIWKNDPGNDICYKTAFVVKNVLENCGALSALIYGRTLDQSGIPWEDQQLFLGRAGMQSMGVNKPVYYAFYFLSMLQNNVVQKGDGYCITRSEERDEVQILLYHYSHYRFDEHLSIFPSVQEVMSIDRYYYFEDDGVKNFHIYLKGLPTGRYEMEQYRLDREHGSCYDIWQNMGAPAVLSEKQREYLQRLSVPHYRYLCCEVFEDEETMISEILDSHAVMLITLKRIRENK